MSPPTGNGKPTSRRSTRSSRSSTTSIRLDAAPHGSVVGSAKEARSLPMSEQEFMDVSQQIACVAAARHRSVKEAFRTLPTDSRSGITRMEMRRLFRDYGFSSGLSDRFFDRLDHQKQGSYRLKDFQKLIESAARPHDGQPRGVNFEDVSGDTTPRVRPAQRQLEIMIADEALNRSGDSTPRKLAWQRREVGDSCSTSARTPRSTCSARIFSQGEFKKIARQVGLHGIQMLRNLSAHGPGKDGDSQISAEDVKKVFRKYEIPANTAQAFFDVVDRKGRGRVDFETVAAYMSGQLIADLPVETDAGFRRRSPESQEKLESVRRAKQDDVEFRRMVEMISFGAERRHGSMAQFLKHCRRCLGKDKNFITRDEIRLLLRQFGYKPEAADNFFDRICGGTDFVDYHDLMQLFAPHIQTGHVTYDPDHPRTEEAPAPSVNWHKGTNIFTGTIYPPQDSQSTRDTPRPRRERSKSPQGQDAHRGQGMARSRSMPWRMSLSKQPGHLELDLELSRVVRQIGEIIASRYGHSDKAMSKAFQCLDSHDSGHVCLSEAKVFFRNHGYVDETLADRFFDLLDDGRGQVDVDEFKSHFAVHIQPGHTSCRHINTKRSVRSDGFDGTTTYRTHFYERPMPP